ncbi:MAG: PEGA domain-containing protein [Janthinobacterium lividum]
MKPLAGALALLLVTADPAFAQQNTPAAPTPSQNTASPAAAVAPASAPAAPNTLQNGTAIKLKLTETLSSASAKTGQKIPFEVVEEVDVEGVPVIAKGAQAIGTVTNAEPKRAMGRPGKLDVNIDSVRMINGETAALSATKSEKGGGHTGAMTAGIVGTAIIFFPAAPLLLFIHGKDISIPEGTEITAFVSGDNKLDMAKFAPGGAAVTTTVAGVAPSANQMASLAVESSVKGADIEIDGSFVGSTPSTLSVAPGQHTVTVKKKGYADWSRSMNIAGNAVHLNADLTAAP